MTLQPRHRYAASFHDDLPTVDVRNGQGAATVEPLTVSTCCNPAQICQVGAGGSLLRGLNPRVHSRYTFLVRLPDL